MLVSTIGAFRPGDALTNVPETLRLMLDGTVDGYDSFEDAVAAQPAEALPDLPEFPGPPGGPAPRTRG